MNLKEEQTAETIRDVALSMKKVQASVLVEKFEQQIKDNWFMVFGTTFRKRKKRRI